MCSCAKRGPSRRSPTRTRGGRVKNGPAYANGWNSPFSPHGSTPARAISRTKPSSIVRPSHEGSSFAVSTHVSMARPPIATNSASRSAGGSPQIGSTCSSPARRVRSSYHARTSARWMSPNTMPVQPSRERPANAAASEASHAAQRSAGTSVLTVRDDERAPLVCDDIEARAEHVAQERSRQRLARRAVERDRAVTQHEKARRHRRREVQIVEHREHDEAAVAREPDDDVEQRTLMCGIEVHRRLIEEQHVGLLRERHRQDRTLPLTT